MTFICTWFFPICFAMFSLFFSLHRWMLLFSCGHVWLFCDPMRCSPPGFSVHGISQARILEWVAISFSRGSSPPRDGTHVSCIAGRFFTTEPNGKPTQIVFYLITICFPTLNTLYGHLTLGYLWSLCSKPILCNFSYSNFVLNCKSDKNLLKLWCAEKE